MFFLINIENSKLLKIDFRNQEINIVENLIDLFGTIYYWFEMCNRLLP